MKKTHILATAILIILGSVAMPFVLNWAMPMFCMCELVDEQNTPGEAEERIVEHFGPIILHKQLLREERSSPRQNALYQDWKRVETVHRFRAIVIMQWCVICGLLTWNVWKGHRQQNLRRLQRNRSLFP